MSTKYLFLIASSLAFTAAALAETAVYKIDPVHSEVGFRVRHFFNKVPGSFNEFQGEIHFDKEHPDKSKAVATINVGSVDTRNDDRDAHLQKDDFFGAGKNPTITFTSTKWEVVGPQKFKVTGDLTMMGVTKPVTLDLEFLGEGPDREGKAVTGWSATGKLDRTEWGMKPHPVVGSEVDIVLDIQARAAS